MLNDASTAAAGMVGQVLQIKEDPREEERGEGQGGCDATRRSALRRHCGLCPRVGLLYR